jgi:hypothetical protein
VLKLHGLFWVGAYGWVTLSQVKGLGRKRALVGDGGLSPGSADPCSRRACSGLGAPSSQGPRLRSRGLQGACALGLQGMHRLGARLRGSDPGEAPSGYTAPGAEPGVSPTPWGTAPSRPKTGARGGS